MLFRDSYHQLKRKRSRSKMVSQEGSGSCKPSFSISNLSAYNELLLLIACLVPLVVGPCVLPALIAVLSIIHAVEEVFQIWIHRGAHFKSKENRLDFAVCALTGILYALVCTRYVLRVMIQVVDHLDLLRTASCEVLRHVSALLLLFSCVKPLLTLSKHPNFKKFDKFFPMFMKVRPCHTPGCSPPSMFRFWGL